MSDLRKKLQDLNGARVVAVEPRKSRCGGGDFVVIELEHRGMDDGAARLIVSLDGVRFRDDEDLPRGGGS